MRLTQVSNNKVFDGLHQQYQHFSSTLDCQMQFAVFLPPQAEVKPVPVVYWLSGLTCSDENFMQKAGALRMAAKLGIAIVTMDTSPRGEGVADVEDGAYDLGLGAGFYLNATQAPWVAHYQMYDYVVKELPELIEAHFPVNDQRAISGHSMGGHGALVIGLTNCERYSSISAFSPICHPMSSPWGQKAFTQYLGDGVKKWQQYDASLLLANTEALIPILIDQGDDDPFLDMELKPESLLKAIETRDYPLILRMQSGYDHSYYFIATFIEEHLGFHAKHF
ncbi:S-formylglutathione hydrolase [Shewanella surugensis]|uniref:S-formylglutathione hydrolase n=1 Tax=Shewanella surugensis TaxID=212020 RepID=A0ABT0LI05_9GAMM|nr:S-formylglutathione hydrolase [Shewanella surugensis]MCL1126756.1 S-formylglutathione hydrolase [Shewanella surugensis]